MENIIVDKNELRKFIAWLPNIGATEAYLVQLMVRSRGLKEKYGFKGSDHVLMQKAVHGYHYQYDPRHGWEYWRTRLYYQILRMGVLAAQAPWEYVRYRPGTLEIEDVLLIPPLLLALYIQINPSRVIPATIDAVKDVMTALGTMIQMTEFKNKFMREVYKRPDLRYYSGLARRRRTIFHVVDVDTRELIEYMENEFNELFGFIPPRIVTQRGKHFIVNIEELKERNLIKKWADPKPSPEIMKALGDYKVKRTICMEKPYICEKERKILEKASRNRNIPLMWRIKMLEVLYTEENGSPLIEIKKQGLEPVPGMMYKGVTIVRFQQEEI